MRGQLNIAEETLEILQSMKGELRRLLKKLELLYRSIESVHNYQVCGVS